MTEDDYQMAQRRVKKKKGFYRHLTSYVLVMAFLFILNVATSPMPITFWVIYPALGWGLGIAFHYVGVFGLPWMRYNDPEWEEKELEKELGRRYRSKEDYLESELNDELELRKIQKRKANYNDDEFV